MLLDINIINVLEINNIKRYVIHLNINDLFVYLFNIIGVIITCFIWYEKNVYQKHQYYPTENFPNMQKVIMKIY